MAGGGSSTQIIVDENGFNPHGSTFGQTISSLVKSFIGAGALTLAYLFKSGGTIPTTLFLLGLACVALYAIFLLVDVSNLILLTEARKNMVTRMKREIDPNATHAALFEVFPCATDDKLRPEDYNGLEAVSFAQCANCAFGIAGSFINFCIMLTQFGMVVAYIIFVSSNFQQVLGGSTTSWALIITPLLAGLILIPNLSKLAFVGIIGNIVYFITIVLIFWVGIDKTCCVSPEVLLEVHPAEFPVVFGTISFSLEGIVLAQATLSKMYNPKQFKPAMSIAMIIVIIVYFTLGFGGFILFAEQTTSPLLDALPKSTLSKIARLLMSSSLFFTAPFQFFPITAYIISLLNAYYKTDADSVHHAEMYFQLNENENVDSLPQHDSNNNNNSSYHRHYQQQQEEEGIDTHIHGEQQSTYITQNDNNNNNNETLTTPSFNSLQELEATRRKVYWLSVILRFVVLALVVFIAIVFSNFQLIIAFFGSFANSTLAFIAPTALWIVVIARGHRYVRNCNYFDSQNIDILRNALLSLQMKIDNTTTTTIAAATTNSPSTTTTTKFHIEQLLALLQDKDISSIQLHLNQVKEVLCNGSVLLAQNINDKNINNTTKLQNVFFPTTSMFRRDRHGYEVDIDDILLRNIVCISNYILTAEAETEKEGAATMMINSQEEQQQIIPSLYPPHTISNKSSPPSGGSEDQYLIHNNNNNNTHTFDSLPFDGFEAQQQDYGTTIDHHHHHPIRKKHSTNYSHYNGKSIQKLGNNDEIQYDVDYKTILQRVTTSQPLGYCEFVFYWMLLPATVVVVGVAASIIGVIDSVQDLINEFWH